MKKLILLFSCLTLLTSCGSGFKRTLGLNKQSPNEFAVIRQPPLSMPPTDYLLAPADQNASPSSNIHNESGAEILLGKEVKKPQANSSLSSSDRSFIDKTSNIKKKEQIKEIIKQDNAAKESKKKKK